MVAITYNFLNRNKNKESQQVSGLWSQELETDKADVVVRRCECLSCCHTCVFATDDDPEDPEGEELLPIRFPFTSHTLLPCSRRKT